MTSQKMFLFFFTFQLPHLDKLIENHVFTASVIWSLGYIIALLPVQYNYKQIYHDMVEPRGDDFVESLRVD